MTDQPPLPSPTDHPEHAGPAADDHAPDLPQASAAGRVALRVLAWLSRGGTLGLVAAGLTGLATAGLALAHRVPTDVASAVERDCLTVGVTCAAAAMVTGAVRAGAIERRRQIERERSRRAAERAHREAYLAREAAREAAARETAAASARTAEVIAAARAAAPPPAPDAMHTTEEVAQILERARHERERLEEEMRIETAIRNGTRAA